MSFFFIHNGQFFKEGTPVINADNHSFRYGDGLFETIKVVAGKLFLERYHFERLFYGLKILGFDVPKGFTSGLLKDEIIRTLKKNGLTQNARIRLVIFRGNGSLHNPQDHFPNYIIQTWPLNDPNNLNTQGLLAGLYQQGKKSCDGIANLKTNNFLLYTLAAMNAKKNNLDDCILLNTNDRICDTSVANIFIIKDKNIFTPPLTEGCIAGVMRKWFLEKIKTVNRSVTEQPLYIEDVKQADELFLTNSIYCIRWVKQFHDAQYTNKQVQGIYNELFKVDGSMHDV